MDGIFLSGCRRTVSNGEERGVDREGLRMSLGSEGR